VDFSPGFLLITEHILLKRVLSMQTNTENQPEVAIIGGGFGGLNVAKGLKNAPVLVTLVDKQNYHLFQPLLYQVATAELSQDSIAAPIRRVLRDQKNARVAMGKVVGVDLDRKSLIGLRGERHYDYLVIATGVEQSYYGHDEFKPYAPGMKTLDDAIEIQRRVLLAFEEAEYEGDEDSRRGKLTFVVVGGGPTGVELAGAIMETATRTLPEEFRFIDTKTARVLLVQGGDCLLKNMPEEMGKRAKRDLESMGVELRFNSYVTSVDDEGVMIGDERVRAENVLWAAGIQGTPVAKSLGVELDRIGRVIVNPDLSVPGHPEVFVIGDAAHVIDANTGEPVPGVAQGAIQMGGFVAKIIQDDINGATPENRPVFSYFDKGSMATISRGKAVASIKGATFSGLIGWLLWGVVHIMFLVGFRSKVTVVLEWFWNFLTHERGARLITGDPEMKIKEVRVLNMFDDGLDEDAQ
jgi:NADH dehydrogenase